MAVFESRTDKTMGKNFNQQIKEKKEGFAMKKRLYVTIHVLQTMPASCINRDDTGSPKETIYGGAIRARVSSQAWKRAMKIYFSEMGEETGLRTREIQKLLVEKLIQKGITEEDAIKFAIQALKSANLISDKENKKPIMLYLSEAQINAMIELIEKKMVKGKDYPDKNYTTDLKKAVSDHPTGDMLLFGRMMAMDPSLSYDAACQVAHAFSVNETREEYDYFTAVDEFVEDHTGAGHIDSKSYNSGVYYRFANINLSDTSELIRMDKPNAVKYAKSFIEAFIRSLPSGSCNSFANTTLPDVVMIELRDDNPVSYAPAFIEPVNGKNYLKEAEEKLLAYKQDIERKYGKPIVRYTFDEMSLKEMLNAMEEAILEVL